MNRLVSQTINQVIQSKFMQFHEDIVIKQDLINKDLNRITTKVSQVPENERIIRSSFEYELLGEFRLAENVPSLYRAF